MKPENLEKINRSFELQAPNFESKSVNFTNEEYLNYIVSCVAPCKKDALFRHLLRRQCVLMLRFPC